MTADVMPIRIQGEIKATGFNEQCDAFYDLLQEGKVREERAYTPRQSRHVAWTDLPRLLSLIGLLRHQGPDPDRQETVFYR